MKKVLLFAFFLTIIVAQAQQSSHILSKMSNAERDSMGNAREGFIFLNTSTGFINYRFQNQWMEVPARCTPYPEMPRIDSVLYENGETFVFFSPVHQGCAYTIYNDVDNVVLQGDNSPISSKSLKANTDYRFRTQAKSVCGESSLADWSKTYTTKAIDYCKGISVVTDKQTNKTYPVSSVGKACWMAADWLPAANVIKDAELKIENGAAYCTWNYANSKDVCPDGWHLPSTNELLRLRQAYQKNPDIPLFKQKVGGFDFEQQKIIEKDFGFYWSSTPYSFAVFAGVGLEIQTFEHKNENVGMSIRCIMD